ncbi:MAG: peptidoglycan-associated lipoprotein [Gammaproteobacteria bacterium]|jgi:peptidoglycan-associated lipoprotein|tara:strand:+ start:3779 stop:4282 length:504 start_codon:yes stop_codon:yes gene_type:complete
MPKTPHIFTSNFFGIVIFTIVLSSCSSMNVTEETLYNRDVQTVQASVADDASIDYETKAIFTNATVLFEFDSFNLSSKSIQTLKGAVAAMKSNSAIKITISGHADERGTREYNLALGQRRAESVKDYFALNGINKSRVSVKSYGEERPLAYGTDEISYAKNRRAEIN